MMDYYKVLGVQPSASQEEIKKAYRSLAMKHHPDRGGDPKKFQEIQEAYATLSDDQKRAEYDNPNPFTGGQGGFSNHFGDDGIFSTFFGGPHFGFGFQQAPRNSNIGATVEMNLEDVMTGKQIDAEVTFRNGQRKLVSINIPAGIDDNIQIRYPGMGDHSQPKFPPGDLVVTVRVRPHHKFKREGVNLIFDHEVSVWEALLGSEMSVDTLDGKTFTIGVPAGTQPDTMLSCRGEGLPHHKTGHRGNLLIRIKVKIPKNLTQEQKQLLEQVKNGI
jgi:curved DNA-binding protein